MKRKLRRLKNSEEAMIAGVCLGWAYWLGVPVWVVRLIWAVSGFHGFGVFLYIAMWIFMPEWDEVPKDFKEVTGDSKHYICTGGCGGVSETPGVCQAEDCPDHGKQLKECDCADEKHAELDNDKGNE